MGRRQVGREGGGRGGGERAGGGAGCGVVLRSKDGTIITSYQATRHISCYEYGWLFCAVCCLTIICGCTLPTACWHVHTYLYVAWTLLEGTRRAALNYEEKPRLVGCKTVWGRKEWMEESK